MVILNGKYLKSFDEIIYFWWRNWRFEIRIIPFFNQNKNMNREINNISELALANLLDLIPMIPNTGDEVDPIILRIYERNAAVLDQN